MPHVNASYRSPQLQNNAPVIPLSEEEEKAAGAARRVLNESSFSSPSRSPSMRALNESASSHVTQAEDLEPYSAFERGSFFNFLEDDVEGADDVQLNALIQPPSHEGIIKRLTLTELRGMQSKEGIPDKEIELFFKPFADLEYLDLDDVTQDEFNRLFPFIKDLKKLKHLKISSVPAQGFERIGELTNLITLELSRSLAEELPAFLDGSLLQEIHLQSCLELKSLKGLENCKNLNLIKLESCSRLTSLKGIENCSNIATVHLANLRKLTSLIELQNCPNLVQFHIENCFRLSSFKGIESYLVNVLSFDQPSCYNLVSMEGFENCPNLSSIILHRCDRLKSIKELKCPNLKIFDVSVALALESLEGLENSPKLISVYLDDAHRITSLKPLEKCFALETLSLSKCLYLTSLQELKNCTRLKMLNIQGTSRIDSLKGVEKLINLQQLIVSDDKFSINELNDLKDKIPGLVITGRGSEDLWMNLSYKLTKALKGFFASLTSFFTTLWEIFNNL